MALLVQIVCALLVVAVLLNGGECRPDPIFGAVKGLVKGLPGGGELSRVIGAVDLLALPVLGGLVKGLLGGR